MRWTPGGSRANIEDRRGSSGGGFRLGGGRMGLGGAAILLVLSLIFGRNLFDGGGVAVDPTTSASGAPAGAVNETPEEAERVEFVTFVLNDAQQVWAQLLPKYGGEYHDAKLVLFRDAVQSGCGGASAASGPFYCPLDEKAYIDLSFYEDLSR